MQSCFKMQNESNSCKKKIEFLENVSEETVEKSKNLGNF